MRLLLGLLLLLSLFTLALVWQRRTAQASSGAAITARDSAGLARPYASDWTRLVVGGPSGAEPIELAPTPSLETKVLARGKEAPPRATTPAAPTPRDAGREFELVVRKGQTLSSICQAHYKTARPAVVEAVARYNRMADTANLREGQKLKLPPIETLLEPRR